MKSIVFRKGLVIFTSLMLLLLPAVVLAQTDAANSRQPPIAPQLVREGTLAVKLTPALGLGIHDNEAEAESILGNVGIVPRNGWIADYPVTPDIIGELEKSVGDAAVTHRIMLDKDDALNKLREVNAGLRLAVTPYSADQRGNAPPANAGSYPDPAVEDDYYSTEGPPVVTYYVPPPDYYSLYAWVPYPFWCSDFWFPGFFILNDFHRPIFFGQGAFFVSNHFHDFRSNRVFRINPVGRFNGRTIAGIGITHRNGAASTGVPRGERRMLNGTRNQGNQTVRSGNPAFRSGGRTATVPSGGSRASAPVSRSSMRSSGSPSFSGSRMASPASFGGGRGGSPAMHGGGGSFSRGGRR